MIVYLREGCTEDLSQVADISSEALWHDPIVHYLAPFREQYPRSHRDHYYYLVRKRFLGGDKLLVVVAKEEKSCNGQSKELIVGFAFWSNAETSPHVNFSQSSFYRCLQRLSLWLEGQMRWYLRMDRSFDRDRLHRFWHILRQSAFFDPLDHGLELEMLAVRSYWQRRGIGTMLLRWGLEMAKDRMVPVSVAATICGRALYQKLGFIESRQLYFEEGHFTWYAMIWDPPD